jgi:hypothetical protein
MRIIAGGMFTIAGAIMVSTSAALAHVSGSGGVDILEALGGVCLIAGGVLSVIGMREPKSA